MKKLLLVVIVCSLPLAAAIGQSPVDTTRFYIKHLVDQMTDKNYYIPSTGLLCTPDGKKGFRLGPDFEDKRGKIVYRGLSVKSVGIGSCVENSELIFLFEDGTKLSARAWNDFNCDGNSWFDLRGELLNKLIKPLKAIRFTNGRDHESYTHSIEVENKNYFIDVKTALDGGLILNKGFVE